MFNAVLAYFALRCFAAVQYFKESTWYWKSATYEIKLQKRIKKRKRGAWTAQIFR